MLSTICRSTDPAMDLTRRYEVFVALGDPDQEPAWMENKWDRIASILDPLIQKARGPATVRTTQLRVGSGSPNQRGISFGRIGWNAQAHKKWVHRASPSGSKDPPVFFVDAQVWAPSPKTCEADGLPPDIYLAVRNEQSAPGARVSFNPVLLLAVALDLGIAGRSMAEAVADLLGAYVRVRCIRPWGFRVGEAGFANAIGDLCVSGLFKPGPRNQKPPSADLLAGNWEAL
jgi:hypothetical protein